MIQYYVYHRKIEKKCLMLKQRVFFTSIVMRPMIRFIKSINQHKIISLFKKKKYEKEKKEKIIF